MNNDLSNVNCLFNEKSFDTGKEKRYWFMRSDGKLFCEEDILSGKFGHEWKYKHPNSLVKDMQHLNNLERMNKAGDTGFRWCVVEVVTKIVPIITDDEKSICTRGYWNKPPFRNNLAPTKAEQDD